ncbi:MAG: arsenate reductase ArsC [Nitrospinae bacterium]|nr:arsenate reductase ArsC [Nitrospinota bacterium]
MKLLFVCVENSCRSQIAEGFARYYGKEMSLRAKSEAISVYSAGSRPSGDINPMAVDVMEEKGIDISNQKSKGLDALSRDDFDFVITMGCGDNCPTVSAKKMIEWQIKDPKGASIEVFREVRDEIEKKVLELLRG